MIAALSRAGGGLKTGMTDPFVCPDPLAERRYAYAAAAAREGDWAGAAEVLEQTLERAPAWPPALFALGIAREKLGERDAAAAAYRATLAADGADRHGAGPRLALLEGRAAEALPPAYVARLFDDYAPRFDAHLTAALGYSGPEQIGRALDAFAPGRRFVRALDLGCGSGLMGVALRARVDALIGVDLSAGMVAKARERALYDTLDVGDAVAFLAGEAAALDLVVAADALGYFGDLRALFAAVSAALAPGGLFVFSHEAREGAGFALSATMRFQHSDAYVRATAEAARLELRAAIPASTRREAGVDVPGRIVICAPATADSA